MPARMMSIIRFIFFCVALSLLMGCTHCFFTPSKQVIENPEMQKYDRKDVYFVSPDGLMLLGWYFPAKAGLGTILVCHGNMENMSTHVMLDLWLIDAGYNLFIFDYRGFGRSAGTPDIKGVNLDAEAALETLLFILPHKRSEKIIVFGKSLGGAVAVYTVAHSPYKDRVKALILDSTFSSFRTIAREKVAGSFFGWIFQYPLSHLVNDDFSPIKHVKNVAPVPILIIHGSHDDIVSVRHAHILYDAALPPKELWEVAVPGHVRAQADDATRKKLLIFLSSLP